MATEAQLAREGAAVAGACFALLGAGLAGRARRHAAEALSWQRQWSQAVGREAPDPEGERREARRLARAYRAAGAAFALGGLALLASAWLRPGALAAWQRPPAFSPAGALALGALLSATGFALAWAKASRLEPPATLAGGAPRPTLGERLAEGCGWALSFLLSGYGLRLMREALR